METKRKTLFEERYHQIKKRHISFLKTIEEKAAKMHASWVPFLPNDIIFKIFLLLPVRSLLRFTCVCKAWYKLIHCAEFVEAYSNHAEITPIIVRGVDKVRPNTFHVETHLKFSESFCMFPSSSGYTQSKFIHFLEIENGKGKLINLNISCSGSVVATCNGLILITSVNRPFSRRMNSGLDSPVVDSQRNMGRLSVMNPMTRKLIGIPVGTLPSRFEESYGLAFSHSKGVFKVVHLFKDKLEHIACEIYSLQTRTWKAVDGPLAVHFSKLGQAPIATVGALHWLPGSPGNDYIITMGADDERFSVTDLPTSMGYHDRLVEMGGFLSLVNSLDKDHIDVWVLKRLDGTEWVKQHTIHVNGLGATAGSVNEGDNMDDGDDMDGEDNTDDEDEDEEDDEDNVVNFVNEEYSIPSFALSAKEMVFRRKERFYSYDFELEEIKEIVMEHGRITAYETIMPHYNNLATWEPLEPMS